MNPNQIPGLNDIYKLNPVPKFKNLGDFLTGLFDVVFYLAFFLAFFWIVWAAFQYILAGGDKTKLAEARKRIIFALVGLIVIALAFCIMTLPVLVLLLLPLF